MQSRENMQMRRIILLRILQDSFGIHWRRFIRLKLKLAVTEPSKCKRDMQMRYMQNRRYANEGRNE